MHMQLHAEDFVLMFDHTDSGPSYISLVDPASCAASAAALNAATAATDCSVHSVLLDICSNALHPYPLATNPWCSSAALLSNGALLQTGNFPKSTLLQTGDFSNAENVFESRHGTIYMCWSPIRFCYADRTNTTHGLRVWRTNIRPN